MKHASFASSMAHGGGKWRVEGMSASLATAARSVHPLNLDRPGLGRHNSARSQRGAIDIPITGVIAVAEEMRQLAEEVATARVGTEAAMVRTPVCRALSSSSIWALRATISRIYRATRA